MAGTFITNQERLLSIVMKDIMPFTEKLYFLVGYFYFSGFDEIYDKVIDNDIKILVGLDIEKDLMNRVKEVELLTEENISRGDLRERFYATFVQLFNETNYFDTERKQESFKLFVSKIRDGSLEIRKSKSPNHAKMYLFENKKEATQSGTFPGTLITGSSNLTASGLSNQFELNVIFRSEYEYKEGKGIFDKLWSNAVDIATKENIVDFETKVLERIWHDKLYKPYFVYLRVLHEYFSVEYDRTFKLPSEITKNKYINLKYQTDAIKQALSIINTHKGVIIADVVGLGKSIIASTVAHNLGLKTIVIAPPHLVQQWDDEYRSIFEFNAKVFSSGSIEYALEYFNDNYNTTEKLIIIDEAHKYRNESTQDYANLHKLCQGNKVILLSATPFNNRPQDIFSLVKLFQIPAKSTLKTVSNLSYEFSRLIKDYKELVRVQKKKSKSSAEIKAELERIARLIRDIISPLVIRRSRIDLREIDDYKEDIELQGIDFPIVNDPELLEYQLGSIESLYIKTLEQISSEDGVDCFQGVRYKPITYLKDKELYKKKIEDTFGDYNLFQESQINISKFMRHLLVRRFESSVAAFKNTLEFMIRSSKNILQWYSVRGKIPIYKKGKIPSIDDYYNTTNDTTSQIESELDFENIISNLKSKGLFEIDAQDISEAFKDDLERDIKLLESIHEKWFVNGTDYDPKLDSFKELLKGMIQAEPERKIIVFSEFADTVNYLNENLDNDLRTFKYTSADASKANKDVISRNFDAGISPEKMKDDYDILIATDAISEGYNLHRAGTIINYDIPYNPTRVIQRVGRINRINKKVFEYLNIYNYFPTETGEKETRTKEISTLKIAMVQALLGEDTRILTKDEELKTFFKERYDVENLKSNELSWDVPFLNQYNYHMRNETETMKMALSVPVRSRLRRTVKKDESGVLVFGKKGNDFIFRLGTSPINESPITAELALKLFEASVPENAAPVSKSFEHIYEYVKSNLFRTKVHYESEKLKNDILLKIKKYFTENKDYLKDLISVIELDALPRHYMTMINNMKVSEQNKLPIEITQRYLSSILRKAASVDEGEETLIISEELI
jgi:superfamily II DNA or RNA helicase